MVAADLAPSGLASWRLDLVLSVALRSADALSLADDDSCILTCSAIVVTCLISRLLGRLDRLLSDVLFQVAAVGLLLEHLACFVIAKRVTAKLRCGSDVVRSRPRSRVLATLPGLSACIVKQY